jgi:hypothetical protein
VYKIHGKVLIRQDIAEAKSTVNSRIKLIQSEMSVRGSSLLNRARPMDPSQPSSERLSPPRHPSLRLCNAFRRNKIERAIKDNNEKRDKVQQQLAELQQKRAG